MGLRGRGVVTPASATSGLFAPLSGAWGTLVTVIGMVVAVIGAPQGASRGTSAGPASTESAGSAAGGSVAVTALARTSATTSATASATASATGPQDLADDEPLAVQQLIEALSASSLDTQASGALLEEGFRLFLDRMAAMDGPSSVGLARAMYARDDAIWSTFCLEGALRRSAPADTGGASAQEAYAEADRALSALLRLETLSAADRVAVVQRRAILAAGFADTSGELSSLGRALGMGGIDGAQILGLKALVAGDHGEAARLFGLLIDRGDPPQDRPWALRGHGLASLERIRRGS